MKVMVMVKATKNSEAGALPTAELVEAMTRFNDELVAAGVMLAGDGLSPSSRGKRVRFSSDGKQRQVIDGPFTETRELVAGFWLWEVKSMDEALEWARRCPAPMPGEESDLELRPIIGLEDFGDVVTPEILEREARQRAALAAKAK
ncbi:MAG: YciI family protein [Polyangiaceae bacterium]